MYNDTFKVAAVFQAATLLIGVAGLAISAVIGEAPFDVVGLLSSVHGFVIVLATFLWIGEARSRRRRECYLEGVGVPPYGFAPGPARVAVIAGWLAIALVVALRSRWPLVAAMPVTTLLFAMRHALLRREEAQWERRVRGLRIAARE